jgi:rhodanese-related sulfurtransferase
MKTISREDLKKKIDIDEDFQLVDVRGKHCCFDLGHLPKAVSMQLNEIDERATRELEKDKPVIVYCSSFSCSLSPRAAHILEHHLRFKDVSDFEGGIKDWKDAGYPIER